MNSSHFYGRVYSIGFMSRQQHSPKSYGLLQKSQALLQCNCEDIFMYNMAPFVYIHIMLCNAIWKMLFRLHEPRIGFCDTSHTNKIIAVLYLCIGVPFILLQCHIHTYIHTYICIS